MRPSLFGLECAAFEGFFFCGHYTRPALHNTYYTILIENYFFHYYYDLRLIEISIVMAMISLNNNSPFMRWLFPNQIEQSLY